MLGFNSCVCTCGRLLLLVLIHILSWRVCGFGSWVHTGRDLAAAGELQHAVEWQLIIFVRARKLGSNDSVFGLEYTERKKNPESTGYDGDDGYQ